MMKALQKIANPIKYLRNEAKDNNLDFNGFMVVQLVEEKSFYQKIAKTALNDINNSA